MDSVIAPPHAGCDDGVTPHVAEINVLTLNIPMLGFISAVTAALDVGLFFSSRATFQRGGSAL